MNDFTLLQLRDVADQLSLLAGTLQTKPFYLRAKQIRQADKALGLADALFTPQLTKEAKHWKSAKDGLFILKKKLNLLEEKQIEIDKLEQKISQFKTTTKAWFELEENERLKIIQNTKRANQFIANQHDKIETHILHRYKRFVALKDLAPYSENTTYFCEAIYHYENREKYQSNIVKLEEKIRLANDKLKTVKRGFWVAIVFCFLVMTIPICFPFSISLWRRKKELSAQTANFDETLKRENKRLVAADEGANIAQDIRQKLGNVSLERIREILVEVRDLRSEFLGPDRSASSTALLLNFLETSRAKLEEVFGPIPEEPLDSFYWLSENVNKYQNTESIIFELEEKKNQLIASQKQLVKGYSKEMLVTSIEKLEEVVNSKSYHILDKENLSHFVEVCVDLPPTLSQIRELLYYASRNMPVDLSSWSILAMKIQSYSNILSLCVLDAEILDRFSEKSPLLDHASQTQIRSILEPTREEKYGSVS